MLNGQNKNTSNVQNNDIFRYAVKSGDEWSPEMIGTEAADPTIDNTYAGSIGKPIEYITIGGVEKYRVFSKRGKWGPFFTSFDKDNPAGNGTPILAIEIWDKNCVVGIHVLGGNWLTGASIRGKGTVGIYTPIDALWIDK